MKYRHIHRKHKVLNTLATLECRAQRACDFLFITGYPGLDVPVPLFIVYFISHFTFFFLKKINLGLPVHHRLSRVRCASAPIYYLIFNLIRYTTFKNNTIFGYSLSLWNISLKSKAGLSNIPKIIINSKT